MRRSIERLVGHINGRFGEHDWTPVRYLNRTYSRRSVTGFCAISKVGLVTPLRDGLNLVAEEYVAAQPEADRACSSSPASRAPPNISTEP